MSKPTSIRAFIGAEDFIVSRQFYLQLGFEEVQLGDKMSYFKINASLGFYLQDYYVKDWVENTMLFVEIEDVENYRQSIINKRIVEVHSKVRITEIIEQEWGSEFHLFDPSGILWHFGKFNNL